MIKAWLHPLYRFSHDFLFWTRKWNPFFLQQYEGQGIGLGHISEEHLQHPQLDQDLAEDFETRGIAVHEYEIDIPAYRDYLEKAHYPQDYYGGGKDEKNNFTEKTLEHFVSAQFLNFQPNYTFVDIAACSSPFHRIVQELYQVENSYQQDLIYPVGIHGHKIGGWAHELLLPDQSVDGVTLHCSLEHFEGDSDTLFFQELARVLKPGARAVILPFYLAHEHSNHIDPAYNLIKNHHPPLDPGAKLRYCSWYQFFSRHYSPAALEKRIMGPVPELELTLYRVQNFREVDPRCYLRWIGVFERK